MPTFKGSRFVYSTLIFMAMVGIFIFLNPVGWNNFVAPTRLDFLAVPPPTLKFGGCNLEAGDLIFFKNGIWTTSIDCEVVQSTEDYGQIAYFSTNQFRTMKIMNTSMDTGVHVGNLESGCVFIIGFDNPSGVELRRGCVGFLNANDDTNYSYEVVFNPWDTIFP